MLVTRMANWIATEGADTVIDWAEAIPEDEDDNTTEQRKQFTNSLITAIEEAKKKEFYRDE